MFDHEKKFARKHIILTSTNHVAGGFGLALILQNYFANNSFLPIWIGWILLGYAIIVHIIEWMR